MVAIVADVAVDQAVETLKFLGDRNRLRILAVLTRTETCVCDLIDELDLPQPLVSYHLGKLRTAGLVRSRRDAQWVYYSLDPDAWERLTAPLAGILPLAPLAPLPPEAAYGASRRCDSVPPDQDLGACPDDDGECC
ncbi:MAG: metalloregulator ArsR/SmtB family transcription factor [Thermomicrobiales bacterium]